ncbi:MAG: hypothetical protein HY245_10905 [Rhizobiales bacterium]|nr:hypothetical protein [Hyphomicrobiales bacterium]
MANQVITVAPKSMIEWIASDRMPSEPVRSPAASLASDRARLASIESWATWSFSDCDMAAV